MSLAIVTVWPQIGHDVLPALSKFVSIRRDFCAFKGFGPSGSFEGMTTPLTLVSCFSSKGVMVGVFLVGCELGKVMFVDGSVSEEEKESYGVKPAGGHSKEWGNI